MVQESDTVTALTLCKCGHVQMKHEGGETHDGCHRKCDGNYRVECGCTGFDPAETLADLPEWYLEEMNLSP